MSKTYTCPTCNWSPPEFNGDYYTVEGKDYPQFTNETRGSTPDGSYHDWDETHYCPTCKSEFTYSNGAY